MTAIEEELGIEYYNEGAGKPDQQASQTFFGEAIGQVEAPRQVARTAARIGETIAGLPGDVRELFNSIAVGIPEYFAGEELPAWRRAVKGTPQALGGFTSGPTSEQLRTGVSQPLGGEFLEPQSKWEEFGDEVAQDFAALALPVKGKVPFARSLGTSIMANAGGEVAGAFGGDKAEAATKLGLLFAGGMLGHGQGGVKQHIRGLFNEMEAAVPENAEVSAKALVPKLDKIEATLRKGDPLDVSKAPAFQKIRAIKDKISGGMIPVDEAVALNKSTNEAIFGLGELKRGQHKLYDIRNAIHETLGEYGQENAEFLTKWKNANEAYAATKTSREVSNWVRKNVRPKDYAYALGALGLEGGIAGIPAIGATVAGAGALGATAYGAEVMKRVSQSPALRKYYGNVVKHSLNQNKTGFTRAMGQLDKGLKKSFEEEPYETIEFPA